MAKGKVLNEFEKGQIQAFSKFGIGIHEIARLLGRSHNVVRNFLSKGDDYGKTKGPLVYVNIYLSKLRSRT